MTVVSSPALDDAGSVGRTSRSSGGRTGSVQQGRELFSLLLHFNCNMSGATTPCLVFVAILFRIPLIKSYVSDG